MKKRNLFLCLLAVAMLLSACAGPSAIGTNPGTPGSPTDPTNPGDSGISAPPQNAVDPTELFSDRDLAGTYDANGTVITFSGSTAQVNGDGASLSGRTVTIDREGTYILRGTLDDGMVLVAADSKDKVQLVLDNVSIHSQTCAAIYVRNADKVFITLPQGSVSTLSNGGSFVAIDESNIDAVIFSKDDLTLNGTGSLTVTSPAGHGIVSKNELTITGGTYDITAASHGLTGKDNICITAAELTVRAGKDGLHGDNAEEAEKGFVYIKDGTCNITCDGDGVSSSAFIQIDGGDFTVVSGGGYENGKDHGSDDWGRPGGRPRTGTSTTTTTEDSSSTKGFKAVGVVIVNGGTFNLNTADDGFHCNADLTVNGGNITVSTGDDGFHSDEKLTIAGGTVVIAHSYEGLEGLNVYVSGGNITITATDDGINAAGGTDQSGFGPGGPGGRPGAPSASSNASITICGGTVYIRAGGDGIDANGSLTMTGGSVTVHGPTQGDTSVLDFDTTGIISGGTFIGTGAANMAQTFSQSENQGVIAVRLGRTMSAGMEVKLTDSDGNVVISTIPADSFGIVILSCPQMVKGQSYRLTVGTIDQTFTAE